jgi:hypothetical protein
MTWATDRRLDYIDLLLLTRGQVRRADIEAAFGVSQQQASGDLQAFIAAHPQAMMYDKSAKQYVPADGHYRPARERMADPAQRKALMLLTQAE